MVVWEVKRRSELREKEVYLVLKYYFLSLHTLYSYGYFKVTIDVSRSYNQIFSKVGGFVSELFLFRLFKVIINDCQVLNEIQETG